MKPAIEVVDAIREQRTSPGDTWTGSNLSRKQAAAIIESDRASVRAEAVGQYRELVEAAKQWQVWRDELGGARTGVENSLDAAIAALHTPKQPAEKRWPTWAVVKLLDQMCDLDGEMQLGESYHREQCEAALEQIVIEGRGGGDGL
ncbi:MAG TPA: hypothetical protein VHO25_22045 [Polyangiaceae bacterium]|nr:hypothetical protein [Polyangiaceae bacterium]